MNKRRASAGKRCLRCKIHNTLCFCGKLTEVQTKTRVSIIMHHRETHLTSNTANLACLALPNCKISLRGLPDKPFSIESIGLSPDEMPLYLFPHEDAIELTPEFFEQNKDKKFHLIVPDGTWSQAVKFYRREVGLQGIQCVKLPPGVPGRYKLRKSSDENRLSTYEALARALGILENDELVLKELDRMFDVMVDSVVRGRTAFEN
ncbi:tRNA-uridine aminocarboxypropyltransferase [Bacteriovorax sp. PP10]|uniref:tRNA-uridine aminocarboxypropyltransferase n=1 Tax=Bacteriovorax antarcticus TaxID=3088717 RepID=A0ABU5VYV8_9BACT|nr:tRNA-uridine aminocarboxypropyltransferase [Bacteriovorax sp. PP10]MEA9358248.1 tRNA-uridine aminocarboxypropyltransferase [Bacteriovorax sp. PP10]